MDVRTKPLDISDASNYAGIFSALGDPVRMQIIRMIANESELACTVLDDTLPISKSTISYHIKVLYRSGLISVRKEGRYYFYKLRRDVFAHFLPQFVGRLRAADPVEPKGDSGAKPKPALKATPPQVSVSAGRH
jgi:DNA-binding transcriptional ArsR family regulator